VPMNGAPIIVTNYVSITTVSVYPPLRQIRSDCVWSLLGRPFTNTVVMLHGPDQ
jgi:hypothetical protein